MKKIETSALIGLGALGILFGRKRLYCHWHEKAVRDQNR